MKTEDSANSALSVADCIGTDVDSIIYSFKYHLTCTLAKDEYTATKQDQYHALALAVRDLLIGRWLHTQRTYHSKNVKRVAYLSLEFMIGRLMSNNIINMSLEKNIAEVMERLGIDESILDGIETDAALGNGGLGRLAACFLDSIATLKLPGIGYGIRYEYGVFKQHIDNGWQVEEPDNWLASGNPWEVHHPEISFEVHYEGHVVEDHDENGRAIYKWVASRPLIGTAYDTPIVGYESDNVNCLRLWSARARNEFDFQDFSRGSYVESVDDKIRAENLTKVLYPNDAFHAGRELRLRQQYFFVSCSIQDIIRRFKHDNGTNWDLLPEKVFIQMNDTHPALVVPELMRLLIDREGLSFEKAWELTVKSCGYTNHTLMPEALEVWPVPLMEWLLPRHMQIIYAINQNFLELVSQKFPGDVERLSRMSIIREGQEKAVRMAHLAIVGSSSTNGVAALHTQLLKEGMMKDFYELYPDKFNSKTNGVTPRRWILKSNPALSKLVTEHVGERSWVKDLDKIRKIESMAEDKKFQKKIMDIKLENKKKLAQLIQKRMGIEINPDSMVQSQIKRIHEYKRQLLQCMYIIWLYEKIIRNPKAKIQPQTFIFAGKAAPAYNMAKLVIKLINSIANVVNNDPIVKNRIKVAFIPDYCVSLAEVIIPASDVSVQISTAGMEASGTGNMKFAMNGALTIGTLDGANIEIMEEVGDDNIFIFGLKADEVAKRRAESYKSSEIYQKNKDVRTVIDMLKNNAFSANEPGIFYPIVQNMMDYGDYYMNLADFPAYIKAQEEMCKVYNNKDEWAKKCILNIARMGKFSSDRTIKQYAEEIWHVKEVDVDFSN